MRVLIAHSAYSSATPSGENIVAEAEASALRDIGVEAKLYLASPGANAKGRLRTLINAGLVAWNPLEAHRFATTLAEFRPQVVHFHNLFPHLSPSVIPLAKRSGAKVVMTLHNYRWFCVNGLAFRAAQRCYDCAAGDLQHAVRHQCYRNSRLASWQATRFIRAWQQQLTLIDHFFALSPSQEAVLHQAGIPRSKLSIKPNFCAATAPCPGHNKGPKPDVIYVGRLGPEKGLRFLVEVWKYMADAAPRLDIVGEGEERAMLEQALADHPVLQSKLKLHGMLPYPQAQALLKESELLVVPSIWGETFGLNVIEASRAGVPILSSPNNGPSDLLRSGIVGASIPLEVTAWAKAIHAWLDASERPHDTKTDHAPLDPVFTAQGGAHLLHNTYQHLIQ